MVVPVIVVFVCVGRGEEGGGCLSVWRFVLVVLVGLCSTCLYTYIILFLVRRILDGPGW